jgi:hypothetical protein
MDALIRYFFHIDPEALDDDAYFRVWRQIEYVMRSVGRLKI